MYNICILHFFPFFQVKKQNKNNKTNKNKKHLLILKKHGFLHPWFDVENIKLNLIKFKKKKFKLMDGPETSIDLC